MNLAILSDTRKPTLADNHHGLGKSVYEIARGLALRGHTITLFAGPGSVFEHGALCVGESEYKLAQLAAEMTFDAYLDGSHEHLLSKEHPGLPVVNRLGDLECPHLPPNVVVATKHMQARPLLHSRLIPTGIDAKAIPFFPISIGNYLVFMGAKIPRKGWPLVQGIANAAHMELRTGENLTGREKWNLLGNAVGLLHPSFEDAAPRLPLEAAACGVPTLCLDVTGTPEHVAHCLTGFVCADENEMVDAIRDLPLLNRRKIRDWVKETHPMGRMIDAYEQALSDVAKGERW